jgi:hypothetical protein
MIRGDECFLTGIHLQPDVKRSEYLQGIMKKMSPAN